MRKSGSWQLARLIILDISISGVGEMDCHLPEMEIEVKLLVGVRAPEFLN